MEQMTEMFKQLVQVTAEYAVNFMELLSIAIIVVTTAVAFWKLLRGESSARIYLLHGQSLGLSFKLGSEILRTITVRNMNEILEIGLLIVIKAAMTWLIHWELQDVEEEQNHSHKKRDSLERSARAFHPETNIIIDDPADAKVTVSGDEPVNVEKTGPGEA